MNAKTHYKHCEHKHKLIDTLFRVDRQQEECVLPSELAEKERAHARLVAAYKRESK